MTRIGSTTDSELRHQFRDHRNSRVGRLVITIEPASFETIEPELSAHLSRLPTKIDSFLESHTLSSTFYRVNVEGRSAGFGSITTDNVLTQFALEPGFRHYGQRLLKTFREQLSVRAAFVPTSDEFFLAHAVDEYRTLTKQAYFFSSRPEAPSPATNCTLRVAVPGDEEMIRGESGDFFDNLHRDLESGHLFINEREGEAAGFGIIEPSVLYPNVASVGMYTIERWRTRGVGTTTIAGLVEICREKPIEPIAGCWYGNSASKRTLERAGMAATSRLLRIEF